MDEGGSCQADSHSSNTSGTYWSRDRNIGAVSLSQIPPYRTLPTNCHQLSKGMPPNCSLINAPCKVQPQAPHAMAEWQARHTVILCRRWRSLFGPAFCWTSYDCHCRPVCSVLMHRSSFTPAAKMDTTLAPHRPAAFQLDDSARWVAVCGCFYLFISLNDGWLVLETYVRFHRSRWQHCEPQLGKQATRAHAFSQERFWAWKGLASYLDTDGRYTVIIERHEVGHASSGKWWEQRGIVWLVRVCRIPDRSLLGTQRWTSNPNTQTRLELSPCQPATVTTKTFRMFKKTWTRKSTENYGTLYSCQVKNRVLFVLCRSLLAFQSDRHALLFSSSTPAYPTWRQNRKRFWL